MNDTAVATRTEQEITAPGTRSSVLDFANLAQMDGINEQKLRVLWDIQKEYLEQQRLDEAGRARVAYFRDLAAAQAEFPVIGRDAKNDEKNYRYARFETIWAECCPIWTRFGFSATFPSLTTPEGLIRTSICIQHREGHVEIITSPDAPPDATGTRGTVNKTAIQANLSTGSYQRRSLVCSGFGIVTASEDNDGASSPPATDRSAGYRADPPKPPAPTTPDNGSWLSDIERMLLAPDSCNGGWEWRRRIIAACKAAPNPVELDKLFKLPVIARLWDNHEGVPPDSRTAISVALMEAGKRFSVAPSDTAAADQPVKAPPQATAGNGFTADVISADGEVLDAVILDPDEYVEALIRRFRQTPIYESDKFLANNAAAIAYARQRSPKAAAMIDAAKLGPADPDVAWVERQIAALEKINGMTVLAEARQKYHEWHDGPAMHETEQRLKATRPELHKRLVAAAKAAYNAVNPQPPKAG